MNDKTRERALWVLNSVFEADPDVAHQLAEFRVEVKDPEELPDAVVVLKDPGEPALLGLLGIVNGILGLNHRVCGVYNDTDGKLLGFKAYVPSPTRK